MTTSPTTPSKCNDDYYDKQISFRLQNIKYLSLCAFTNCFDHFSCCFGSKMASFSLRGLSVHVQSLTHTFHTKTSQEHRTWLPSQAVWWQDIPMVFILVEQRNKDPSGVWTPYPTDQWWLGKPWSRLAMVRTGVYQDTSDQLHEDSGSATDFWLAEQLWHLL